MTLDRKPHEGPRYHGKFAKVRTSKSPTSSPVLRHRTKSTASAPDSSLLTDKRLSRSFESLAIFDDPSSGENNDIREVEETTEPVQGKPPKGERRGTLQRLFTKAKSSFDLFAKAEKAEKTEMSKSDTMTNVTQTSRKSDDDDDDDDDGNDDEPWKPRPRATSEPLKSGDMLFSLVAFDDVTKSLDDLSSDRRNVEETLRPDSTVDREMSTSGSVFLSTQNNEASSSENQPDVTMTQEHINEHNQTAEAMVHRVDTDLPDDEASESLQGDLETSSEDGTIPENAGQADDNYELIFEMEMDKSLDDMQLDIQNTPTQDLREDIDNTSTGEHGDCFPDRISGGTKTATIGDVLEMHTVDTVESHATTLDYGLLEGDRDSNDKSKFNELDSEEVKKTGDDTTDVNETSATINESSPAAEGIETPFRKSSCDSEISEERFGDASTNIVTMEESEVQNSDEGIPEDELMRATESQVNQIITCTQSPDTRNQNEDINEAPAREKGTDTVHDTAVNKPQSGTQISSLLNVQLQVPGDVGVTPCHNSEDSLHNRVKSTKDLKTGTGNVEDTRNEEPIQWEQRRILEVESEKQHHTRQLEEKDNHATLLYEVQTNEVTSVKENHNLGTATGNQNSEQHEVEKRRRKDVPEQMANLYEVSADIPNLNFDTIPPEIKQIILRTVDMNQVSVSKTEPIQETVCKADPVDHSVLALELIDDRALEFPECSSSIPRCTCDALTYNIKRNAMTTMAVSKQDSQIVLNETNDTNKQLEKENQTSAPGTDAMKSSNDLPNKMESNLKVEVVNQNSKESNDNESNKEVNTEFTTKWKIYVYHTTVVLETISGPGFTHTSTRCNKPR